MVIGEEGEGGGNSCTWPTRKTNEGRSEMVSVLRCKARDRVAFVAGHRQREQWRGEVRAARGRRGLRSGVIGARREQVGGMGVVRRCRDGSGISLA